MLLGSLMPWLVGSTRLNGYLDWTGMDDTGEGAMLIVAALALGAWIRLRGALEEISGRARFIPMALATGCGLLWVIAFRKALYLSWFELEVGARPQPGLLIAGFGILVTLAGGLLAATDPDSVAAARAADARERRGSGAGGGVGAASSDARRRGENPSSGDEYSVVGRVAPATDRDGEADEGGPAGR